MFFFYCLISKLNLYK
jgi:hypothetical protein